MTVATLKSPLARLRPHAPELQFWGYEGGNILAALAGAGGLLALRDGMAAVGAADGPASLAATLLRSHPDIAVTLGLAFIVLLLAATGWSRRALGLDGGSWGADLCAALAGVLLVGLALSRGVDQITAAAVLFVSGSALLRGCAERPILLKPGGVLIALGGLLLASAGLAGLGALETFAVASLTVATGAVVAVSGLMTYAAGIRACEGGAPLPAPFGGLAARLDGLVLWILRRVGEPAIFWVDADMLAHRPMLASMWTRLPLRLLLASAALGSGTEEGALLAAACLLWAVGDVALGSLDAD